MLPTSAIHLLLRKLFTKFRNILRQVKPPEVQPHIKDERRAVKDERGFRLDLDKLVWTNPPQVPRLLQGRSQLRLPAGVYSLAVG